MRFRHAQPVRSGPLCERRRGQCTICSALFCKQATSAEFGDVSIARSSERSLADQLLAKHMHEEHHSTLNVSILEARGLRPRSGELPKTPGHTVNRAFPNSINLPP